MEDFLRSIEIALDNKNWYCSLFTALTLPDICSSLERPSPESKKRYIDWFNRYLEPRYKGFLTAEDCYALRCSYIHEGNSAIDHQSARVFLDKYLFLVNGSHLGLLSGNVTGSPEHDGKNILVLSVVPFCSDFIEAARAWLKDVAGDTDIQTRIANMLKIEEKIQLGKGGISIQ